MRKRTHGSYETNRLWFIFTIYLKQLPETTELLTSKRLQILRNIPVFGGYSHKKNSNSFTDFKIENQENHVSTIGMLKLSD